VRAEPYRFPPRWQPGGATIAVCGHHQRRAPRRARRRPQPPAAARTTTTAARSAFAHQTPRLLSPLNPRGPALSRAKRPRVTLPASLFRPTAGVWPPGHFWPLFFRHFYLGTGSLPTAFSRLLRTPFARAARGFYTRFGRVRLPPFLRRLGAGLAPSTAAYACPTSALRRPTRVPRFRRRQTLPRTRLHLGRLSSPIWGPQRSRPSRGARHGTLPRCRHPDPGCAVSPPACLPPPSGLRAVLAAPYTGAPPQPLAAASPRRSSLSPRNSLSARPVQPPLRSSPGRRAASRPTTPLAPRAPLPTTGAPPRRARRHPGPCL